MERNYVTVNLPTDVTNDQITTYLTSHITKREWLQEDDRPNQSSSSIVSFLRDTHTQPFNGPWSGTTRVGRYENKHSRTHTHPDPPDILYQLPPSAMIHRIIFVQFTCLTILFDNLSPGPLWSSSWSGTLYFILPCMSSPNQHLLCEINKKNLTSKVCWYTNKKLSYRAVGRNLVNCCTITCENR